MFHAGLAICVGALGPALAQADVEEVALREVDLLDVVVDEEGLAVGGAGAPALQGRAPAGGRVGVEEHLVDAGFQLGPGAAGGGGCGVELELFHCAAVCVTSLLFPVGTVGFVCNFGGVEMSLMRSIRRELVC